MTLLISNLEVATSKPNPFVEEIQMKKSGGPFLHTPQLYMLLETCQGDLMSYLPIEDVCKAMVCSKEIQKWARAEVKLRYQCWKHSCSCAWYWETDEAEWWKRKMYSADALALDDPRSMSELDMEWQAYQSPSSLIDSVAGSFGSSTAQFLYNRENGAPQQQCIFRRGERVTFTTLGKNANAVSKVLIFDIYCDDRHKWSGVRPINRIDVGSVYNQNEHQEFMRCTSIDPFASKSLGDLTHSSTIHPMSHGRRAPNYLLSTAADDTRVWKFNVSLLTPTSKETLIMSVTLDVQATIKEITEEKGWEKDSGYSQIQNMKQMYKEDKHISEFYNFETTTSNDNLWRCSILNTRLISGGGKLLRGIGKEGNLRLFDFLSFDFCYWLDKRTPDQERFHLTMDFQCQDELWSDLILRA